MASLFGGVVGQPVTRVKVFVDYQNTYMRAREAFGDPAVDRFTFGQVFPESLGVVLTALGEAVDPNRELVEVRVYRGEPDAQRSPVGQAACQRQVRLWSTQITVTPVTRPLQYRPIAWGTSATPTRWEAREKGIDVLIAIDLLRGAMIDEYDVAVLVSADTDLVPAVEAVLDAGRRVELAAWRPEGKWMPRLNVPGHRLWCHYLDRRAFERVRDDTDYTQPVRNERGPE